MANDVFECARRLVSTREAAEYYGFTPNRAGYIACPFHNEKTPSLKLYTDGGWYCFGCHAGGGSIDFVAELFGLSPLEAVRRLNADFHLSLPLDKPPDKEQRSVVQHRREVQEVQREFEQWRDGFLSLLNQSYRVGYTALQNIQDIASLDQLTDREALALRWLESLENWSDCLYSDSMTEQMQIFRDRRRIGQLCEKILNSTRTKSGVA